MKEEGLWELFWRTGLPEVYLAICRAREMTCVPREERAKTAFTSRPGEKSLT